MNIPSREDAFKMCDQIGIAGVRAGLDSNTYSGDEGWYVRQWLYQKEDAERAEREKLLRSESDRAVKAAERSAKWTSWAAIAAAAGSIVTMLSAIIPLFHR